uniref:Uncharacterized protein n=1 Tax=Dulem virus 30 TaxID=3145748 RepID=A0AAU8B5B2_9CAUD
MEFLIYKRDSWIYNMKQTEEGRAILKDLDDLNCTMPSDATLRDWGCK